MPVAAVWLAAAAFAGVFGTAAVLRHRAFESGRFDLGNMTQAVWSTANGDFLSVTDVHGEQISRLGSHFDPILAALAPLWWLWPDPELLLVVQAIAVAAGAIPIYWLARKHLDSDAPAAALAIAYLLYPPVQWLTLSDFHPVALACPLLLYAWWHLDERHLWSFALLAAAAIAAKEHVGLAVAAMGVWYAVRYRSPRRGVAIAVLGGAAALLATLVIVPHFAPAGSSAFESRYDSPSLDGRDLSYLAALLFPLAFLPLAAPLAALAAAPEIGLNLLSSTLTQTSVKTHYAAVAVPALFAATIFGAARLGPRLAYFAVAMALAGMLLLGPLGRVNLAADERDAAARRALAVVPAGVPVSATNTLGAHLSDRRRIFSFPLLREARWVVVDEQRLTFLDSLKPGRSKAALAKLRRDPGWRPVFVQDGVLVFRHR
ncbi:MAG: hypothetical protein QOF45_1523 [Gaiellaceae bacterium]|jgi:uncharacterized membrane protein|nr:hypothetical protein [Gaiellaceae bacterium]